MKPSVFLDTCHLSHIGGGENYLMRFATALSKHADVYIPQQFDKHFLNMNGFITTFKEYDWIFQPDIHLQCNFNFVTKPIGKKNVIITFFPKKELRQQVQESLFDDVITICPYSARYVSEYWGINKSTLIYPAINQFDYVRGVDKENQIISIGHFFQEADGHSKNQHILVEAFRKFSELRPDWKLVLIGNVGSESDATYMNRLYADTLDLDIEFHANAENAILKTELGKSRMLWHANGYGRTDPAQTEHFGIIVLEALASNVIPFVHASGGAQDIEYTGKYATIDELVDLSVSCADIVGDVSYTFPEQYTIESFERTIEQWWGGWLRI